MHTVYNTEYNCVVRDRNEVLQFCRREERTSGQGNYGRLLGGRGIFECDLAVSWLLLGICGRD